MRAKNRVINRPTYPRVLLGKALDFGYTKVGAGEIPSRFHQELNRANEGGFSRSAKSMLRCDQRPHIAARASALVGN
jgi:hypothetical protein